MLNKQKDKTHWGRFSSSISKYNGTTSTHMCGGFDSVKNRLYTNKIASDFCSVASHSRMQGKLPRERGRRSGRMGEGK